ncbi:MAG: hypothetical protein V1789_05570 [PVC group bacterium]
MKKTVFAIICFSLLIQACSPVEMGRRVIGTSVQSLEEEKIGRFSGIVLAGKSETYQALIDVLQEYRLYIYLDSPGSGYVTAMWFNRLYPSCIDTTEVGFFFKEEGPDRTRLDVVSLDSELARFAAEMIFEAIDSKEGISMLVQPTPAKESTSSP